MHRQLGIPVFAEGICTRIIPDVGSIAPKSTQFHIVNVTGRALLENENQLVLRPVKAPHSGVCLGPDAKVFELAIEPRSLENFLHMAPIHADVMDGSIYANGRQALKCLLKKFRELGPCHLARRHREFPVPDFSLARDMARHRHVVGRIGEDQLSLLRA